MSSDRLRAVVVAGYRSDEPLARAHLDDDDPEIRAAALGALHRMGHLTRADLELAAGDAAPAVRSRAAECAIDEPAFELCGLLTDGHDRVAEIAAHCCGERQTATAGELADLERLARAHEDSLVRESAVAALGAIGAPSSLAVVLDALGDRATVRRRAVIALAAFEGPAVEQALTRATEDRDWQVRQAAEDLLDVPAP